jgi:hypothetical protein
VHKTEGVGAILERCKGTLIANWLGRAKQNPELNHLHLSDEERTGHLPKLVEDLVVRLGRTEMPTQDADAAESPSAVEHGRLRFKQGYTAPMLVEESRILQVTIFGTLQNNRSALDFSVVLTDVMTIADEVDSQLAQMMASFVEMQD